MIILVQYGWAISYGEMTVIYIKFK
jgi:hypothetical protein